MPIKHALIVAQLIPQWYVDVLTNALGDGCKIDIITGSDVQGNVIKSPEHNAESFKSRLICWYQHLKFMKKWMRENKNQKYDLIFAISNPPINSYIGLKLKKQFNAPFVYMNWDLYPQVIESSIKNPVVQLVCKAWRSWNNHNYPKIDRMLTIGDVMAESMTKPMKNKIPVTVIPVAVDTERLKPIDKVDNPFCVEHGLTDKFVILYSGKMGMGHNIEVILEAATLLKEHQDIVFVFIGNGPKYSIVEEYIKRENAANVQLYPLQSEEMFPFSMVCGDIGIATQEASMAHLFMPSKTYSMMACGEAIIGICTDHDDLYRLLESGEFGVAVTETTAEKVVESILKLHNEGKELESMKKCARNIALKNYDSEIVRRTYSDVFSNV